MVIKGSDRGYRQAIPGIDMKNLAHGDKTMMMQFRLAAGSILPQHSHPHEQTGYLIQGSMRFTIDGEDYTVGPGDSWCIAGGVQHRVEVLEDSIALEVFSPPRDDYLR